MTTIGDQRTRAYRLARRLKPLLWLVAVLLLTSSPGQTPRPVAVDLGVVRALVPALQSPAGQMLSLKGVGAALGWRLVSTDPGEFELSVGGDGATLSFHPALPGVVHSPRAFWHLKDDAVREEGDLFLTRSALKVVRRVAEGMPARQAAASSSRFRLRMRTEPGGARGESLILEVVPSAGLAEGVPEVVQGAEGGSWRVVIPWSGEEGPGPWPEQAVGHPLLERVAVETMAGQLALTLVPGRRLDEVRVERAEPSGAWQVVLSARASSKARDPALAAASGSDLIRRIVLDPGHGGEEDGAIGPRGVVEKELVLDVARRVRAKLRTRGFEVTLTREGDVGVPLDARAGIANREKADVFVSIHANAARYRSARGAETYFLAREATDDAARTAAALENNASGARLGDTLDGDLPLILWDMAQTEYLEESQQLAELIQSRLNQTVNLEDRGVRQAPFRVLVGATCPAVLVELGFLSHPEEEALLAQPAYRDRLALALTEALQTFARMRRGPGGEAFEEAGAS